MPKPAPARPKVEGRKPRLPTTSRNAGRAAAPIRTCIGCRRRAPQTELVRVARIDDGTLTIGRTLSGRGAWLCPRSSACFEQAVRRGAFARAFRAPVSAAAVAALRDDFVPPEAGARG
ncbi:MAG: YlxR family protein [Acidimicrobiales bacterium]